MKVADPMAAHVTCCRPDDSLHRAAQLMWDNDLGCLPVCPGDGNGPVTGMITDRDICMSSFLQRKSLTDATLASICERATIKDGG